MSGGITASGPRGGVAQPPRGCSRAQQEGPCGQALFLQLRAEIPESERSVKMTEEPSRQPDRVQTNNKTVIMETLHQCNSPHSETD